MEKVAGHFVMQVLHVGLDIFFGHMTDRVKAEANKYYDFVNPGGMTRFCSLWILSLTGHSRSHAAVDDNHKHELMKW